MGNLLCSVRIRRNDPIIKQNSPLFSKAINDNDYDLAAKITFNTMINLLGVSGIMNALEDANNYINRKNRRKGL